jgi:hypothetical protein
MRSSIQIIVVAVFATALPSLAAPFGPLYVQHHVFICILSDEGHFCHLLLGVGLRVWVMDAQSSRLLVKR